MKIRVDKSDDFAPFDVTFSVETAEEARVLYAIFNYFPNTELLPEGMSLAVRSEIGTEFGDLPDSMEIAKGITYEQFYRGKGKG